MFRSTPTWNGPSRPCGAQSAAGGDVATETAPQIGVHDFAYGAIVLGIRYWVPSRSYHQTRYAVNSDLLAALRGANIPMLPTAGVAVPLRSAAEPDGT